MGKKQAPLPEALATVTESRVDSARLVDPQTALAEYLALRRRRRAAADQYAAGLEIAVSDLAGRVPPLPWPDRVTWTGCTLTWQYCAGLHGGALWSGDEDRVVVSARGLVRRLTRCDGLAVAGLAEALARIDHEEDLASLYSADRGERP